MAIGLVLREGSVSIPKRILSSEWATACLLHLDALCDSGCLTKVYVSTDSDEIAGLVKRYNSDIVEVFERMPVGAVRQFEDAIIDGTVLISRVKKH